MIPGHCRTNLDGFDCSEVQNFVAVPRKGEKVQVKYRGKAATLEVCQVTHKVKSDTGYPYIEVELTGLPRE